MSKKAAHQKLASYAPGPGLPQIPEGFSNFRALSEPFRAALFTKVALKPFHQVVADRNNENLFAIERMLNAIYYEAIVNGDEKKANFILDQTFGKIPEKAEFSLKGQFQDLNTREKVIVLKKALQHFEEDPDAGTDDPGTNASET